MELDADYISHKINRLSPTLIISCLILLILTVYLIHNHLNYQDNIAKTSKQELQQLTVNAAKKIDGIMQTAMQEAETLAQKLSSGKVQYSHMRKELKSALKKNSRFYGASITFKPFAYQKKRKLYSIYYAKSGEKNRLEFLRLDKIYDYTLPDYDWYTIPMSKGSRWGEPYWDEAGKTYMVTYSALFYAPKTTDEKKAIGVVTIDISLAQIKTLIESLDLGTSGFGALTTRSGIYLYHPNYDYVRLHKSLTDIAKEKNDQDRIELSKRVANNESGIIDHISTTTKKESWLIFEPLPIVGWSLQNTFIKNSITISFEAIRQQQKLKILITLSSIFLLINLAIIILIVKKITRLRIALLSFSASILMLIGIGVIWNVILTDYPISNQAGTQIADKQTLNSIMSNYRARRLEKNQVPPIYIPTGVYIDTIEFSDANSILISGKIWQKYPKNIPSSWRGFEIGHAQYQEQHLTKQSKKDGLMSWNFQANVRTKMDYSRYPLELENIAIQIRPKGSAENIILIPDLESYRLISPSLLPGLSTSIFVPGWTLSNTFFSLKQEALNTNFGSEKDIDEVVLPNLYYNIGIKRVVIDAFISNLTPLIVVAIILFSISFLPKDIDISRVLGICVSVFFVVVFSHLAIRKNLSIGEVFYLEYFFFVMYFAILLTPMKAFESSLDFHCPFFAYKDGIFPKVIFWPSILAIFLSITAWKFY